MQTRFQLDTFQNALFLLCGRRKDRLKGLYWEGDGFVLLYKRLESGSFQWPRNEDEARQLTAQQYRWLMELLRVLKKRQFGASSEQTREQLDGQLSLLFNEAEAYAAPPSVQKTTQVANVTDKERWTTQKGGVHLFCNFLGRGFDKTGTMYGPVSPPEKVV